MTQGTLILGLILLACVAANLPFVNQRVMLLMPLRGGRKSLAWRLLELLLWYFIVGGIGMALEKSVGQIHTQGWEFYAVTGSLFLTLAFPGFVFRYLLHKGT